jgi:isopropylmalate/homocitrate/citramalate synthase
MRPLALRIFDETLRDGEQQAGLFYPPGVKLELAHLIARSGVHQIDVMPAVDESEAALVRELVAGGFRDTLTPATLLGKPHVDQAKSCGVGRIVLFYAVSDRLLFLRDPEVRAEPAFEGRCLDDGVPQRWIERIRENALVRIRESVRYATSPGLDLRVDFAAEDASRADPGFLLRCLRELGPRLDHFLLCDTVGVLEPGRVAGWVSGLLEAAEHARLGVHFHNDRGLALENTLEAVRGGASLVSGTFRGLGERAGNVALEQVLGGLRCRLGVEVEGIDPGAVEAVGRRLDALGLRPAPPYSAAAQRHESGIHVHALLQDPRSYGQFPGREPEIWFGRFSGASNFQWLCERILGQPRSRDEYERLSAALKRRALRESRCYSAEEVATLLRDGSLEGPDAGSRAGGETGSRVRQAC